MEEEEGLLDMIAVGCVLEFATALSRTRYAPEYDPNSDEACEEHSQESQARTFFRVIMKTFATKYGLFIDDKMVHPSYLWQHILVGFAAAVVAHMHAKKKVVVMAPGVSPGTVEDALRLHLQVDHPHLLAPFNAALGEDPPRKALSWDGPPINIAPKTSAYEQLLQAVGIREKLDLAKWPIRVAGVDSGIEGVDKYYQTEWPGEASDHDTDDSSS